MSLQTSNTTTKRGLVQFYEKEIGLDYGDVSGNTELLANFIAEANLALDNYLLIWAKNAGTWQADDINHTDFQIITATLTANKRDYAFTTDGNSNRITDVSKVLILPSTTSTQYIEINPVNELDTTMSDILVNTATGTPIQYGKLANTVLLDPIPSYTIAAGIKMVVNREGSYLTTSDTTKIIGVPVYHEYFYLRPALSYARRNNLSSLPRLEAAVLDFEGNERLRVSGKIAEFFGGRERDVRKVIINKKVNFI